MQKEECLWNTHLFNCAAIRNHNFYVYRPVVYVMTIGSYNRSQVYHLSTPCRRRQNSFLQ